MSASCDGSPSDFSSSLASVRDYHQSQPAVDVASGRKPLAREAGGGSRFTSVCIGKAELVLLQSTLNGSLSKDDHPAVPISPEELARDAVECLAAGAREFHIHPRDEDGVERLTREVVDRCVTAVRSATRSAVGVSTGAWIEPDVERRVSLIRTWQEPDYASVNLSEEGAPEVMRALLAAGVGIEAGIWTVADVDRLDATGLAQDVMRVMIEPVAVGVAEASALVDAIHRELGRRRIDAPRLQHGDGESTWILLDDAVARGIDTRIGLEDTFYEPEGRFTDGNVALVRSATARVAAFRD
jgi:uncharacterized protein (DUF849 family)